MSFRGVRGTCCQPPSQALPQLFFACWRNEMKRGQPQNPSTRQGCGNQKIFGRKKRRRSADLRISGCSTPEAQRVACGFGGGPYTPKDSSKKQKRRTDGVRATAGRASGRRLLCVRACEDAELCGSRLRGNVRFSRFVTALIRGIGPPRVKDSRAGGALGASSRGTQRT